MPQLYGWIDLARSLGIAVAASTLLVLVNEGPSAYSGLVSNVALASRVALHYVVPFLVASVSCLLSNRRIDRDTRSLAIL